MQEQELFLAVSEIEDAAERDAYLQQKCAGNDELRQRVETLLDAHWNGSRFLLTPAVNQMAGDDSNSTVNLEAATTDGESLDRTHDRESQRTVDANAQNLDEILLRFLAPSSKPGVLGRLANYEVREVLGRGAFGIVLKAFDEMLHRMVAIKVMSPELAATSPARKRFLREARSSASVRHENVVSIYAVEERPFPYLIMEYVPGQTLRERIDTRGPLEIVDVLLLAKQIASGLAAAHAIGLIHRDIKPANILLESGPHERVKITDFGLARATDDASVTQSGVIAGTPMYMAPEQAQGETIDQRSDLFSLGSVLYVMTSGRPPFRASSTAAVLKRVTDDTPRPIPEILPSVPVWLCNIISRLHEKRPEDRFQSAAEVAMVLENCLKDLQNGATPSHAEFVTSEQKLQIAKRQRRRTVVASILLVAAGVIGVVLQSIYSGTQPPTASSQIDVPIKLHEQFKPQFIMNGVPQDVTVNDNVLTMDIAGSNRDLWVDFEDVTGEEMTIQTQLRVMNADREGYVKLVFMPHLDQESYVMIGKRRDQCKAWIDQDRREVQSIDIPTPSPSEWIDVRFVIGGDQLSLYLNDQLAMQSKRERKGTGFVCLASGSWRCELKDLTVLVHKLGRSK